MTSKSRSLPLIVLIVVAAVAGAIVARWGWDALVGTVAATGVSFGAAKKIRRVQRDSAVRAEKEREEAADLQERVRQAQEAPPTTGDEEQEQIRRIEDAARRRRERAAADAHETGITGKRNRPKNPGSPKGAA